MAEIVLLPEQQFTSVYLEGTGWCWDIPATFDLVPGQSYRIRYDGTDYECVCMDISAMLPNTVAIGNGAAFGLPGNGEPFALMDYTGGDEISVLCLTDSAIQNTHTISIYGEDTGEQDQPDGILLEETDLTFAYNSGFGVFAAFLNSPGFALEEGRTYTVRWDGEAFAREAFIFTSGDGIFCVGVGNPLAAGQESNGDPFCLVYDGTYDIIHFMSLDQQEQHRVGIALGEGPSQEKLKILLMDHTGTQQEHEMPQRLRVDTSDGGTTEFIHEDLVAEPVEKEVELDFSGGDMTVEPEEGTAFSRVTIPVPENLAPENIADGIAIAGVLGAMKAGGVDVKIAGGSFTGGGTVTVQHNLGVVPDLFVAWCGNSTLSGRDGSAVAIGVSRALKDRFGINYCRYAVKPSGSSAMMTDRVTTPLDEAGGSRWIYSASETKITIGSDYVTTFGYAYDWIAIGGLG